jgi:rubrerythrin
MFSIEEIFNVAIRLEENSEAVYRKAMSRIKRPDITQLLEWIAEEEVSHQRWFIDLKARLAEKGTHPFVEESSMDILRQFIGNQSFSLADIDFSAFSDPKELIEIFIEFEQDTVLFYEMLAPFIRGNETKAQLQGIIDEEKNHIDKLQAKLAATE